MVLVQWFESRICSASLGKPVCSTTDVSARKFPPGIKPIFSYS